MTVDFRKLPVRTYLSDMLPTPKANYEVPLQKALAKAKIFGVLEAWLEAGDEGLIAVLHAMARGKLEIDELNELKHYSPHLHREIEGVLQMWNNPCKHCGTHELKLEWVGSAFCSEECSVAKPPILSTGIDVLDELLGAKR